MNKKKLLSLALVVIMIAILSFGTLAWFSADDSVTNKFYVAGSGDENPDDIFSVNVWEEGDDEDNGLEYTNILPGDVLSKVAHVENTGSYDQYIRVKITVSHASIWQTVYNANMVPVTEFVNVDLSKVYGVGSYLEPEGDNFVYYLYYTDILPVKGDMIVFTEAHVGEGLTREQAAEMKNGFQITVAADAVQTKNVGENVYEAFQTVGMRDETNAVNTVYVADSDEVIKGFANTNNKYIVLNADIRNMYAAHKINGTDAELYLNDYTLETASGEWNGVYGVTMTGELAISGYGKLEFGTLGASVGSLTIHGGTVTARRADLLVENGNPIVLP